MAKQSSSSSSKDREAPSKRDLQRQIGRTRESLAGTVDEIKETAEQGYASVKETVSGVMDYREQFQKDPLVWSLGALSAGLALGYTLGYAHNTARRGKHSQVVKVADKIVDELSNVGQSVLMPGLSAKIKELFGFDFAGLLQDMGGQPRKNRSRSTPRRLKAGRKTSAKK